MECLGRWVQKIAVDIILKQQYQIQTTNSVILLKQAVLYKAQQTRDVDRTSRARLDQRSARGPSADTIAWDVYLPLILIINVCWHSPVFDQMKSLAKINLNTPPVQGKKRRSDKKFCNTFVIVSRSHVLNIEIKQIITQILKGSLPRKKNLFFWSLPKWALPKLILTLDGYTSSSWFSVTESMSQ